MTLKVCHECQGRVSDTAKSCPHCGAKLRPKTTVTTWLITGCVVLGLASVVFIEPDEQSIPNEEPVQTVQIAKSYPPYSINDVLQYLGKFNVDVASDYISTINESGNVVVENEYYRSYFETEDNIVRYISVDFKYLEKCEKSDLLHHKDYIESIGLDTTKFKKISNLGNDLILGLEHSVKPVKLSIGCFSEEQPLMIAIRVID